MWCLMSLLNNLMVIAETNGEPFGESKGIDQLKLYKFLTAVLTVIVIALSLIIIRMIIKNKSKKDKDE